MTEPAYFDPHTGKTYPLTQPRWRSDDGNPLMTTELPGIGRGDIDRSVRSLWRYARALPLAVAEPITMGEGCTPLIERRIGVETMDTAAACRTFNLLVAEGRQVMAALLISP